MKLNFPTIVQITVFIGATAFFKASAIATDIDNGQTCCRAAVRNHAPHAGYLKSPRGREEFPELVRGGAQNQILTKKAVQESNRALASSPRFREEHPELLRTGETGASRKTQSLPGDVVKNSALAASPRAREEFPILRISNGGVTQEIFFCVCACTVR